MAQCETELVAGVDLEQGAAVRAFEAYAAVRDARGVNAFSRALDRSKRVGGLPFYHCLLHSYSTSTRSTVSYCFPEFPGALPGFPGFPGVRSQKVREH